MIFFRFQVHKAFQCFRKKKAKQSNPVIPYYHQHRHHYQHRQLNFEFHQMDWKLMSTQNIHLFCCGCITLPQN